VLASSLSSAVFGAGAEPRAALQNFAICELNFVEFRLLAQFRYRKIIFPTSQILNYFIENIKFKPLPVLPTMLYTNIAVQNFATFRNTYAKFPQNFVSTLL
jgi:hypothetical protein